MPGNEAILSFIALERGFGFVPENSPLADQVEVVEDGSGLEDFHVGFFTREKAWRSLLSSELAGNLYP